MRQIHVNCGKFAVLNWQPKIHMRHCVAEFLGERWRIWRRVRDACISDTHQWRISDYQWRILRLSVRQHQWCTSETHISDAFDDCQWCINTYIRRQVMFSNSSVMHQWLVTDEIGPKAKWRSSIYQALRTVILRCPPQAKYLTACQISFATLQHTKSIWNLEESGRVHLRSADPLWKSMT